MAISKPSRYLDWVTDDSTTKQQQPPSSQLLSGWAPGQVPPAVWMNWLFWLSDKWIKYFDQQLSLVGGGGVSGGGASSNIRLINGGIWNWSATSQTLSWSLPLNLSIPGIVDADNQAAAGSVTVNDGDIVYVQANIPFTTMGNTVSGSTALTNLTYQAGIAAGQAITGTGIPAGTTVVSVSGSTVTMSQAATATNTGLNYTFAGTGALTVSSGPVASVVPGPSTIVIARRVGVPVFIGAGAQIMRLHDAEQRALLASGYVSTYFATAGQSITAGQLVYVSAGAADGGRTAGLVYPVDTSAANGAQRSAILGVASQSVSSGTMVVVVVAGISFNFSGLLPGAIYYANPATPGAITPTKPTTAGQYIAPVGIALSAGSLEIDPPGMLASVYAPTFSADTQGVSNEAQLAAALANCAAAGGGQIALQAPFTLTANYTVPGATKIDGGLGGTVLTMGNAAAGLTLASGASMQNVHGVSTQTSGTLVSCANNYPILRECKFTVPASSTCVCVALSGSYARIYNPILVNVQGSATAVGISVTGGVDNIVDSPVYW